MAAGGGVLNFLVGFFERKYFVGAFIFMWRRMDVFAIIFCAVGLFLYFF